MTSMMRADLYRLFHKRSLWRYLGALALGYALLAFVRSGGLGVESVVGDASTLFSLTPPFLGGFLFTSIYLDDLSSGNLATLIGRGLPRRSIVVAKLLVSTLLCVVLFGLVPIVHAGLYLLLGHGPSGSELAMIYAVSSKYLLMTLGYVSLSSVVAYAFQRPTFGVVAYFLLAFGVVDAVLMLGAGALHVEVAGHLLSGVTDRILACPLNGRCVSLLPVFDYLLILVTSSALCLFALYKKETEL